jgi:hypothetical protein
MLVTPNGKEIAVVNQPGTGHYKIQFTSGGELPEELSGLYTTTNSANIAIVSYIERQKQKPKKSKEE